MIVHTTKETHGIPAPTISVFPFSKNNSKFRLSTKELEEIYGGDLPCDDYLTKKTYNQSDALIDIVLGNTRKLSLLENKENIVTEEMVTPSIGRYYVFRQCCKMSKSNHSKQIFLPLKWSLFCVFYFDPQDLSHFATMCSGPPLRLGLISSPTRSILYSFGISIM